MKNIKALRQKRFTLTSAMQAILDQATGKRDLTAEETKQFDDYKTQLTLLAVDIDETERELEAEHQMPAVLVGPGNGSEPHISSPGGSAQDRRPIGKPAGRSYAEMFGRSLDAGGFKSIDEFIGAIHFGARDPRLQTPLGDVLRLNATAGSASEAVPSDGGFLVPTEFSAELLDASLESEIVRPRAYVYPMKSSTRKIAGFDGLDHSSGALYGGFTPVWMNEGGVSSPQKAKTRLVELNANKLALFTNASNELIADGMSFADLIGNALIKAISWTLDYVFLNGDGSGKPEGVLNAPSLVVVAKDSGQPASTITFSNVAGMLGRLHPAFLNTACWVCNSTAMPQLLQMQSVVKNVAGTENVGGSAVPVVTYQDGKFRMLGLEIVFTEKLPALGSQGDILLAAFENYAVGLRKEVSLEKSNAPLWTSDESSFRSILRVDGQDKWNKPFTPKSGATQGWAVTLAARS
jgi:HK97 family phage major capsid protein